MLALFTVSTGEGWTELMFHDIQITKAAIPFYITFFILVNYIVFNCHRRRARKFGTARRGKDDRAIGRVGQEVGATRDEGILCGGFRNAFA